MLPRHMDASSTVENCPVGQFSYLNWVANEVVISREVLRNSHINAFFLRVHNANRMQFEELQNKLEAALAAVTQPLEYMPDLHVLLRTTEQRSAGWAQGLGDSLRARLQGRALPLEIADSSVLRRQFYYAVALHERRGHLQALVSRLQSIRNRMLANARQGLYSEDDAETRAKAELVTQRGTGRRRFPPAVPSPNSDNLVCEFVMQTFCAAVDFLWPGNADFPPWSLSPSHPSLSRSNPPVLAKSVKQEEAPCSLAWSPCGTL
eukprot:jgi/Botrbrau1/18146/Bobra.53_1s0017.1